MQWNWRLIADQCTGCGICNDVCPHDALRMTRDMAMPEPGRSPCVGCMTCVEQCPFAAIEVKPVEAGSTAQTAR